jgi:hypothetical protein
MFGIYKEAALYLSWQQGLPLSSYYENTAMSEIGKLNLNYGIFAVDYGGNHTLHQQLIYRHKSPAELSKAWMVLVVEGHEDLIRWSLAPERNDWNSKTEIGATGVAAYLGMTKLAKYSCKVTQCTHRRRPTVFLQPCSVRQKLAEFLT